MATILVVEDEPSIADNITYALATEGFEALWCRTGAETVSTLAARAIDLVVLDVGLPDANGFELARSIRRAGDLPIIFVTARSDEIDRIVGLEIGADDYVVKPFSPRELTARVKAVLRRVRPASLAPPAPAGAAQPLPDAPAPPPPPPPAARPDLVVDSDRCRIEYRGQTLDLTRYEYRILRLLATRPGKVFSRDEILREAWEEPDQAFERTVDTHVKTLRQKLRAVRPDDDPIATHRGMGYSLKEPE